MKDCIKVHLPNGNVFKMARSSTETITEDAVTELRRLFSEATNIEFEVEVNNVSTNRGLKRQTLVLWGDTLANSYITVERY